MQRKILIRCQKKFESFSYSLNRQIRNSAKKLIIIVPNAIEYLQAERYVVLTCHGLIRPSRSELFKKTQLQSSFSDVSLSRQNKLQACNWKNTFLEQFLAGNDRLTPIIQYSHSFRRNAAQKISRYPKSSKISVIDFRLIDS